MKKKLLKSIIWAVIFLLNGCAMYYRPINPDKLSYNIIENKDKIEFAYRYDVLRERANKKMEKKELKSGIKIVAVKIKNNTDSSICLGSDIRLYSGLTEINLLPPMLVKKAVEQSVIGYIPYFIGALGNSNVSYNGQVVSSFNFGLILWPAIAIGNMITASKANSNFLKELIKYDLREVKIKSGETVYGIIGIQDSGFIPLEIKKNKKIKLNFFKKN